MSITPSWPRVATVNQLRTAVKLEPRPEPDRRQSRQRAITKTSDEQSTSWRISLPHDEAALFDAALQSHLDALITEWKQDHGVQRPPMPDTADERADWWWFEPFQPGGANLPA